MMTLNTPKTQVSGANIVQNKVDWLKEGPNLLEHRNPTPNVANRLNEQNTRLLTTIVDQARELAKAMLGKIVNRMENGEGILAPQEVTTCRTGFTPGSTVLAISGYRSMTTAIQGLSPVGTNIFDLNSGRYTVIATIKDASENTLKTISQSIIISQSNVQSGARTIYINNL